MSKPNQNQRPHTRRDATQSVQPQPQPKTHTHGVRAAAFYAALYHEATLAVRLQQQVKEDNERQRLGGPETTESAACAAAYLAAIGAISSLRMALFNVCASCPIELPFATSEATSEAATEGGDAK